jgi:hypothetical protein
MDKGKGMFLNTNWNFKILKQLYDMQSIIILNYFENPIYEANSNV